MEPLPVRFRVNGVQKSSVTIAYDGLNLLSGCAMTVGTGATATSDSRWSERNIRYDLDGNLLHLERYQEMVTDNGFIQWNGSAASSRMQYFCSLPYKRSAGETILLCGNEKIGSDTDLVVATAVAGGPFIVVATMVLRRFPNLGLKSRIDARWRV